MARASTRASATRRGFTSRSSIRDDWLDGESLARVMEKLREFAAMPEPVDLLLCNYVYEHTVDNTSHTVRYTGVLPARPHVYLGGHRPLSAQPEHPDAQRHLPHRDPARLRPAPAQAHVLCGQHLCLSAAAALQKSCIIWTSTSTATSFGREDQSVNEKVMVKRVDQQLRVTQLMITAVDLYRLPPEQKKLRAYMFNYLSMMMTISSVFLTMDGTPEALQKKKELWQFLKLHDRRVYKRCLLSVAGACNLPAKAAAP